MTARSQQQFPQLRRFSRRALVGGALALPLLGGVSAVHGQGSYSPTLVRNVLANMALDPQEPTQQFGGLFTWMDLRAWFERTGLSRGVQPSPRAYQELGFTYPCSAWVNSANLLDLLGFNAETVEQAVDLSFGAKLYQGGVRTRDLIRKWEAQGAVHERDGIWDIRDLQHSPGWGFSPEGSYFRLHWSHLQVLDDQSVVAVGLGDTYLDRVSARVTKGTRGDASLMLLTEHIPADAVWVTGYRHDQMRYHVSSVEGLDPIEESDRAVGELPEATSLVFSLDDVVPVTHDALAMGVSGFAPKLTVAAQIASPKETQQFADVVSWRCSNLPWEALAAEPGQALQLTELEMENGAPNVVTMTFATQGNPLDIMRAIKRRQAMPWARHSSRFAIAF